MKRLTSIVIFVSALLLFAINDANAQCNQELVNKCALGVGDNATYLKEFRVKLKAQKRGGPRPTARFTVVLNRDAHYRFSLCRAMDYDGEPILELYDANRMLASTYDIRTGREVQAFDFICRKSAIYQVFIYFKEGEEGCAVGILSLVQ